MSLKSSGILRKMPWTRYSFLGKDRINDGIVPNDLKRVLLKDVSSYNVTDSSNLLSLVGKCATDPGLVYNTNWNEIYEIIYSSFSKSSKHVWRYYTLIKLLQNASYLSNIFSKKGEDVGFLKDSVKYITKSFGKNINEVSDRDICRIIYSCSKGDFLKHSFIPTSFLLLLENEVIQRLNRLQVIDLLKILHSISSIRNKNKNENEITIFGKDFVLCICNKILEKISKIGSIDISNLICYLHNYDLLNDKNKFIINRNINKRLYGVDNPDLLLTISLSLCMYKIIDIKNLNLILKKLKLLEDQLKFEDIIVFKLLIYYIKYNNPEVFEQLGDKYKIYLTKIDSKFPSDIDYKIFNIIDNYYYKQINKALRFLDHNFIPYIHGPYFIPICNPITKVVIEPLSPLFSQYNSYCNGTIHTINTNNIGGNYSINNNFINEIVEWNEKINGVCEKNGKRYIDIVYSNCEQRKKGQFSIKRNRLYIIQPESTYINTDYYNYNRINHLKLEGFQIINVGTDFFNSNIYKQVYDLSLLLNK